MLSTFANCSVYLLIWLTACAHHLTVTACPRGWYQWRNSCYIALKERLNWYDAVTSCQRPSSHLIVPNSQEEDEFIMKVRNEVFRQFPERPLWINCDVFDGNRHPRCAGGQDANRLYTNWASGGRQSGKPCISKGPNRIGALYQDDCFELKFVMCEMPLFVPSYCASLGADGRVAWRCLQGNEIKNLTVQGVSECGQACWAEPRCRSFNLWNGGPAKTCQLNNVTRNEVSTDNLPDQGQCIFFEL